MQLSVRCVCVAAVAACWLAAAGALKCSDADNGQCDDSKSLHAFCYSNVRNASGSCDPANYCGSKAALRGKKTGGCFKEDGKTAHCCCNNVDFCNILYMKKMAPHADVNITTCDSQAASGSSEFRLPECVDRWCITVLFKGGAKSGYINTCESTAYYYHNEYNFGTNANIKRVDWPMFNTVAKSNKYNCDRMAGDDAAGPDGDIKVCYSLPITFNGKNIRGKYCCCKGKDNCNGKVSWKEPNKNLIGKMNAAPCVHAITSAFGPLALLLFIRSTIPGLF